MKIILFSCVFAAFCALSNSQDIRGGGKCTNGQQCFSGVCANTVCAADSPVRGKVGENGACRENRHCNSNRCVNRVCVGGGTGTNPAASGSGPSQQNSEGTWYGTVRQGGTCGHGRECYSAVCFNRRCEADSPEPGKVGEGGQCRANKHCYSQNCDGRVCSGSSTRTTDGFSTSGNTNGGQTGTGSSTRMFQTTQSSIDSTKTRQGGTCTQDEQCFSGYCDYGVCATDSTVMGKVGTGGRCKRNEQCLSNSCGISSCA